MRNELEAQKRETQKAEAYAGELKQMLEESRIAYQKLYEACGLVVTAHDEAHKDNCPAWFNDLVFAVVALIADAELASPYPPEGKDDPEATYCRTCGRPINLTTESKAYCEICSRSTQPQTTEAKENNPITESEL